MSIQFGRWNLDGQPVEPEYIRGVQKLLLPYAPDSLTICTNGSFCVLHGAFHTTSESLEDRPPLLAPSETFLTWTGRLDNRSELLRELREHAGGASGDAHIVSSLYGCNGPRCLEQLVGDWSLSVMRHRERKLLLAVDFLGATPLYFLRSGNHIEWSSVLEALVLLTNRTFTLCKAYAAGWLFGFPAADLTPYEEIRSVPPGCAVEFSTSGMQVRQHWEFRRRGFPRLYTNGDYEEEFRLHFTEAVRRRLRSNGTVLSELSGGLDSSSIVCVADRILAREPGLAQGLETLSYLDDSEPNWQERPFVEAVESLRGRKGFHVDVNHLLSFLPERDSETFPCTPATGLVPSLPQQQVSRFLEQQGIRVVLSGMGGDEVTGGVPDGSPELADLLCAGHFGTFFRRALAWSLETRRPLLHIAADSVRAFFPQPFPSRYLLRQKVPWIHACFAAKHGSDPACRPLRLAIGREQPSVQENLYTLESLRRQVAHAPLPVHPLRERRYPFLDRDLIEFLYSVPRAQLVQPGRRRSLMRRALRALVPEAVLERKRKAYVARAPLVSIRAQEAELTLWTAEMIAGEMGLVDRGLFHQAVARACSGEDTHLWRISRTLDLEFWLRDPRLQARVSFGTRKHDPARHAGPRNSDGEVRRICPAGKTQPERRWRT